MATFFPEASTSSYSFSTINLDEMSTVMENTEDEENNPLPLVCPTQLQTEDIFMRWSDESVKLLLALYQENEKKFSDVNYKNKTVWEKIASGMKEKSFYPTATQCANKWKQLKKSFTEVEDNKRATGRGAKSCKFYQELGNILGYKPGVNPVATASSAGRGELREMATETGQEQEQEKKEEALPTSGKKRKRSDSGQAKNKADAILQMVREAREEKKAREERHFAAMQKMHEDKMKVLSGLLELLKKH